jgi:zinc transporter ZupT
MGLVALASPRAIVGTAVAIAAHELPQEVGDFCALRSAGAAERKTWLLQVASSLVAVAGFLLVSLLLRERIAPALPYLLGGSCGFFLYLAGHLASQVRHEGALVTKIGAALLGFGLLAVSNVSTLP